MLQTLWLTDNCIGEEGAIAIGEALRVRRSAITRLSLFRNSIRDERLVAAAGTPLSVWSKRDCNFSRFSPCTARRGANHLSQGGVLPGRRPNHRSPIAKRPPRDKSDRPASGVESPHLVVTQQEQNVELQRSPRPLRPASLLSSPSRPAALQPHGEDETSVEVKVAHMNQNVAQIVL